jgi:hypothetical protein
MNRRFRRVAMTSISAAMLLGFAAVEAGAAQAAVITATSSDTVFFPQTDPPGPCTLDEIGQKKVGRDGKLYECRLIGSTSRTNST